MSKSTDLTTFSKEELLTEVIQLKHQVALLQKIVFGPKSERFKLSAEVPANQLQLGVSTEALAQVELKKTTVKEYDRAR